MPHLDASALTDDTKGLAFLAEVIDVPADRPDVSWQAQGAKQYRDEAAASATVCGERPNERNRYVHAAA